MDIISNVLMNKKFFEAQEEVDEFLSKHKIDPNSVIQMLIMDKAVFADKAEVREWISNHYFVILRDPDDKDQIIENGEFWEVPQFDASELATDTLKTVEIRTGVRAVTGILRIEECEVCYLSLRNTSEIKLSANTPHIIELVKVIRGVHPGYGEIEITKDHLKSMVQNFNEGVTGVDLNINLDHEKREAVGWIKEVFLNYDEDVLQGVVQWCPDGVKALTDKSFRYFSPEFRFNYVHPHTQEEHGPTLLGGALVNQPFLKMGAIVDLSLKKKEVDDMSKTIELKEHESQVKDLNMKIAKFELSEEKTKTIIENNTKEIVELGDKVKSLEGEKVEVKRIAELEVLFKDEKICQAQYDAMKKNPNMTPVEVLALSEKMNVDPKGGNSNNDDEEVKLSADDKILAKRLGMTEENYLKGLQES